MLNEMVFLVNGMMIINHVVVCLVLRIFDQRKRSQLCTRVHFLLKQIRKIDVGHLSNFILLCFPISIDIIRLTHIDLFR